MPARFNIDAVRDQYPALSRTVNGRPAIYLDGPAGSQVPRRVAEAVSGYLLTTNANHGGPFATSVESDEVLEQAHRAAADFLGTDDPDTIVFGANMTTITFALSRAMARTWQSGDEILVTRVDHDANVTPWVLAAADAGVDVRHVNIHPEDGGLDVENFLAALSDRTRLVAFTAASNATGTINPVSDLARAAHDAGALVFVDAVHFAPHGVIDVEAFDADFLTCSAYKFFGPHVGLLWGRRERLEQLDACKLRPASDELPGKWMTGTQNHEGIAGVAEAIEYLADLGRDVAPGCSSRREAIIQAFSAIIAHERELAGQLLAGLGELPDLRVWGITDPGQLFRRVPTVSITHPAISPADLAARLAELGIFTWPGNHYALPFTEAAGLEPDGTLRIGLLHYNTADEVTTLLESLGTILETSR